MKIFYLIGESTKSSFSPMIHDWIYKFLNIQAIYSTSDIQRSNFNEEEKDLEDNGLEHVSGGGNAFKELEGELWWTTEKPN